MAENRLLGQPAPTRPNQVGVGDRTYLPLPAGRWCYLATWRDACSRRVVGWHLAAQRPTELVLTAPEQALTLRYLSLHRASSATPTGVARTPARPAGNASKQPGR
ncbi:MAG: DDE-type integrase/transposase/recombinase [Hymenobacter sp.]|nr:DDE-type integrase/transposase/recombinase [Hymenobacter sp.]